VIPAKVSIFEVLHLVHYGIDCMRGPLRGIILTAQCKAHCYIKGVFTSRHFSQVHVVHMTCSTLYGAPFPVLYFWGKGGGGSHVCVFTFYSLFITYIDVPSQITLEYYCKNCS